MRETVGRNTRTDENVSDGVREDLEFKTHFSVLVAKIMDSMAHAGVISMYFPDTIRFALFHTFGLWSGLAGAQHTHGRSVALTHNSATTTAEGFYFNQHSTTSSMLMWRGAGLPLP
ncbi:hypothetical protein SARC_16161 [Sphaeroforma arctica JP610]|uniref:Uncharacterized protein n=1 Tax=Sphaeroforma arctica JP610 TaxID=667725 RepID=A0A0L0F3W2_9EUKA|nr:hypothetical protein SARC_16161 [Sphaeroforma arctica JP610]KNC71301.1 hypothetical protein SARC_16161 [Sphaeroforma arctica JP610]|eukprot:XP_014145203.1 hypothetical protein SARC_16161 [Sphaeroforma arctica JP610]